MGYWGRRWDKEPGRADGVRNVGDGGVVGVGRTLVAVRAARARFFLFMLEARSRALVRGMFLVWLA